MAPAAIAGIDHVALVVRDIDASLRYFTERLGLTVLGDEVTQASGGARLVYLDAGNVTIQLVSPTGATGPIAQHLAERGEGLHHICLAVENIHQSLESLAPDTQVPVVVGGRARRTAFLSDRPSGLVIELTETAPVAEGSEFDVRSST